VGVSVGGPGAEITQTLYAHMNKIKIKKKSYRIMQLCYIVTYFLKTTMLHKITTEAKMLI
jgi:hypothetical protein